MQTSSISGAQYLSKGLSLIWKPGIRRYVFIPLAINFILLTVASIYALNTLSDYLARFENCSTDAIDWGEGVFGWLAGAWDWLICATWDYLSWLLWPLIVIGVLVIVFFLFSFLANWIAAPFNGLLAEAVERHLAGETFTEDAFSWGVFMRDIPRLFGRELRKLTYYLPRALGCLLLFFILGPLVSIVWFLFNSWMTAIQYIDYPMDNHRVPFKDMLVKIQSRRSGPFTFGALVMLLTMVPVVNLLIMPVAVAGATNLWFDHYRE